MSLSALDYRKRRGLDKRDEQMSLLVQRVSGSYYGAYYMPCAAGVGYSYSPYRFLKNADPTAGMLRLVMGLGTSAVDRTEGSYPRLVGLDAPEKTAYTSVADRHRFSQGRVEVINTSLHQMERLPLKKIEPELPAYLQKVLLEHDFDAERRLRDMGRRESVTFISCKGLVGNETLMSQMRRMLRCIRDEYGYPVDTEFTVNVSDSGEYSVNLLQCRPLQVLKEKSGAAVPENVPPEKILLESRDASMGFSKASRLDVIVYVDPVAYFNMPYRDKDSVAKTIGRINWHCRNKEKHMMLMVPGRVGTSSPELGVPTTFADISGFDVVCEMEEQRAGYNPELSYGSHIFQDLVEAEILYTAVFNNEKTIRFAPEKLTALPNMLAGIDENSGLENVIRVCDVGGRDCALYKDIKDEHLMITI